MTQACTIPNCDGEVAADSKFKTCPNCRASMGMWRRRGIAATVVRRNTLNKYDTRMSYVVADPEKVKPGILPGTKAKKKGKKK